MTMNLITGKAGAPHITSSDQGAMQAGLVGNGNYLLQGGDGKFPAVTMQAANKALVPVLNLVIEGRYARVTAAETVTIESGVTGRNRNDLICVKYTRDSNNIETIALAVLKGTATSGTAVDPAVPSGSILNNSGTVWIPIARIPISGITAGTPVMLVKQLPPMSQLWDSVTQCGLYDGKTDANGFLMVPNPFKQSSGVYSFCQLYPNGMDDVEGKRFSAFPWDITKDRLRFRIRRSDTNGWLGETHRVIVQWFAIKQQ